MKLKQKGYSLIELLIVVAIIGILAAMIIPNLLDAVDRSKQRASVADLRNWGTAVMAYNAEKGVFPNTPTTDITEVHPQLVPYAIGSLRDIDHWNNLMEYFSNDPANDSYTVMSCGKDGICVPDGSAGVTPSTWRTFTLDIILVDGIFVHSPS